MLWFDHVQSTINISNANVYVKPTNTGLLLHKQNRVDSHYQRGLLKTMLDLSYRFAHIFTFLLKLKIVS